MNETPEEPLPAGHPRYSKVRNLNSGAHGSVQLCMDKITNEMVAIKFIERGEKVTDYVRTEIMNHRMLNHPHVIQFREVFLTPKYMGIAMEFAPGGDMFDFAITKHGRLPEQLARWFFQQLVVALDYCHQMNVANRDIKLENTLLDTSSTLHPPLVKLCDFGYSKHSELQSEPGSLVGTPAYLAPEVLKSVRGQKYDGKAADVWSSGVMLYTMLCGKYPFERVQDKRDPQGMMKMYQRIQRVEYEIPASIQVSSECRDLLQRLLVADPAQRMVIQQIYQHPWFLTNLPPGVMQMNQEHLPPINTQSEQEIDAIINAAKAIGTTHIPSAAGGAPGAGAGAPGTTRDNSMNELIDEVLGSHNTRQYDSLSAESMPADSL